MVITYYHTIHYYMLLHYSLLHVITPLPIITIITYYRQGNLQMWAISRHHPMRSHYSQTIQAACPFGEKPVCRARAETAANIASSWTILP